MQLMFARFTRSISCGLINKNPRISSGFLVGDRPASLALSANLLFGKRLYIKYAICRTKIKVKTRISGKRLPQMCFGAVYLGVIILHS